MIGSSVEYRETELPQDACQGQAATATQPAVAPRMLVFGKHSADPKPTRGKSVPYATGLSPSGRARLREPREDLVLREPARGLERRAGGEHLRRRVEQDRVPVAARRAREDAGDLGGAAAQPGTWCYRVRGVNPSIPGNHEHAVVAHGAEVQIAKPTYRVVRALGAALRRLAKTEAGFGLIELLIAMTVMVVAIMAIVAAFSSGMVALDTASRARPRTVADKQMEAYRALPYTKIALKATLFRGHVAVHDRLGVRGTILTDTLLASTTEAYDGSYCSTSPSPVSRCVVRDGPDGRAYRSTPTSPGTAPRGRCGRRPTTARPTRPRRRGAPTPRPRRSTRRGP